MWNHVNHIPPGVKGELSKINEEHHELIDAHENSTNIHTIIEAADLIESVGQFAYKQLNVPLFVIIGITYLRKTYKPVRNITRDLLGKPKSHVLP